MAGEKNTGEERNRDATKPIRNAYLGAQAAKSQSGNTRSTPGATQKAAVENNKSGQRNTGSSTQTNSGHAKVGTDSQSTSAHVSTGKNSDPTQSGHVRVGQGHTSEPSEHVKVGKGHASEPSEHVRVGQEAGAASEHVRTGQDAGIATSEHVRIGQDGSAGQSYHARVKNDNSPGSGSAAAVGGAAGKKQADTGTPNVRTSHGGSPGQSNTGSGPVASTSRGIPIQNASGQNLRDLPQRRAMIQAKKGQKIRVNGRTVQDIKGITPGRVRIRNVARAGLGAAAVSILANTGDETTDQILAVTGGAAIKAGSTIRDVGAGALKRAGERRVARAKARVTTTKRQYRLASINGTTKAVVKGNVLSHSKAKVATPGTQAAKLSARVNNKAIRTLQIKRTRQANRLQNKIVRRTKSAAKRGAEAARAAASAAKRTAKAAIRIADKVSKLVALIAKSIFAAVGAIIPVAGLAAGIAFFLIGALFVMYMAVVNGMTARFQQASASGITEDQWAVFEYLTSRGFGAAQTCAIMGNISQECDWDYKTVDTSGGALAIGLLQWTNNSDSNQATELQEFCAAHGYDYLSIQGQLEFFLETYNNAPARDNLTMYYHPNMATYRGYWDKDSCERFEAEEDIVELTWQFYHEYEGPTNQTYEATDPSDWNERDNPTKPSWDRRVTEAIKFYAIFSCVYDNSTLANAAVSYAWPTEDESRGNDGTPLYRALKPAVMPDDDQPYLFQSCDRGVCTAVRWSGADDNFPTGSTVDQDAYLQSHPELWQFVGTYDTSYELLMPGDIIITTPDRKGTKHGHIMLFVGHEAVNQKYPGNEGEFVHASYGNNSRSPAIGKSKYDPGRFGQGYHIYRYIGTYSGSYKNVVIAGAGES